MTLNSTSVNVARVIGPTIAAVLVATVGIGWCFVVNAVSFGFVIVSLLSLDTRRLHPVPPVPRGRGQLRAGLRYAVGVSAIIRPLLMMALVGTFTFEFEVGLPLLAETTFHGTGTTYSWLIGAVGAGAVAGGLYAARSARTGVARLIKAALGYAIAVGLVAVAPTLATAIAACVLAGVTSVIFLTTGNATIQLASDPEYRGRVTALWSMALVGSTPIGSPVIGALSDVAGPRYALGLGVEAPQTIKGHVQSRFDGVSMRASFDDPSGPSARKTQFYAMLGSRSIWHEGWKAVTTHPVLSGWGHFNDDEWELYHTDVDRAETRNLAAQHPEKVRELVNLWFAEAGANEAFPLDDRSVIEIANTPHPQLTAPRDRYVYRPGTAPVPEWQAVNMRGRSYVIGALVDIPAAGAEGVLFAFGSRFGGHALYVKDNRLYYVNNFVGTEQKITGSEDIPTGHSVILSASFEKTGLERDHAAGTLSLYHGDRKVGEAQIKTQLGALAIA